MGFSNQSLHLGSPTKWGFQSSPYIQGHLQNGVFKPVLTFRVTYKVGILKNVMTSCNAHPQEWALHFLKCQPFVEKTLNAIRCPPTTLQNFDEVFTCRIRLKDKGITITKTFCEAIYTLADYLFSDTEAIWYVLGSGVQRRVIHVVNNKNSPYR